MAESTTGARGISAGQSSGRGRGRGRGGRGGAAAPGADAGAGPAAESSGQSSRGPSSSTAAAPPQAFSARGGRSGGGARLTSSAVSALDALPTYTMADHGHGGMPLSTSLLRQGSHMSEASTTSSMSPHPDCLLCCFPIASYTISTCQHSAQICGTCILRVQLFVKKKDKKAEAAAAASSSSSSTAVVPASGADLLNDENDFKPSPAVVAATAAAEAKRQWKCPYCQSDWGLVLITREYDIHSNNPREMPPPTSSFGLATDTQKYPLHRWVYDSALNVYFENETTKSKYFMMQSLYCVLCYNLTDAFRQGGNPKKKYEHVHMFLDGAQLEHHLETAHQRYLCSACITTRKIFIHEQQIFTKKELLQHFQYGSNDKTVTEYQPSGHTTGAIEPHPFCQFCNTPFFTSDELYVHLTTDHRSCRFCQSEGFMKYFRTDQALRAHFGKCHYLCDEGKCRKLDANHAAFRDVLAHRAHMLSAHSDTMSKEQIKKLQTIDIDFFRQQPLTGTGMGSATSRMAGGHHAQSGHNGRYNPRPEDEYEFRPDSPTRPLASSSSSSSSSSSHAASSSSGYHPEEDFPTLGGAARYTSSSMPRSQSQPLIHPSSSAAQNLFARNEESFPSLSSGSSGPPVAHASGPGTSTDSGFRVRGPPPPASEFPTLRSVVKQGAKLAKKAEEKKAATVAQAHAAPKRGLANVAPAPTSSPPPVQDNRTNSSVPLPLPSPAPAADVAARNKALVGTVRAALRNDPDSFESFKTLSQRFRGSEITCEKYLQRFNDLFARNPAGELDTERLLMELIALLPDEAQRRDLHQEYARAKVMSRVAKMKIDSKPAEVAPSAAAVIAASASSSSSSSASSASAPAPYVAPKARAVASLGPAQSTSPAPGASAFPPPSFARVASPGTFTVVESARNEKESKASAKRAAAAQGIGAFEGVAVRPLKRDEDEEPADFLSAVASKAEKREKEQKEREAAAAKPAAVKKESWTGALAGPTGRLPPGMNVAASSSSMPSSASSPALTTLARQNSNSWAALEGDAESDEPALTSEPVSRKAKQAASKRPSTPPSPSAAPVSDPPLQSLSSSAPIVLMPEPEEVEHHVERISSLRIAPSAKAPLELLALLFQHISTWIATRHGAVNAATNRRFQMSPESRTGMMSMLRQTRYIHALEFSRATRLGLLPGSVQLLSSVVGAHSRFGSEMIGTQLSQSLSKMSSNDLFLLLEYIHHLLLTLTKPTHPDVLEKVATFAADEERRERQNLQFRAVKVKEPEAAGASSSSAPAATSEEASSGGSGGGGGGKKKQKGKQLLFQR